MTGDLAIAEPAGRRSDPAQPALWRGHATAFLLAALLYAILLVYASLVPFVLRPHSLDAAWAEFRAMPFLELGPESRADWIANLVAYAPLAFLIAAAPGARAVAAARSGALLAAIVFCLSLAVVVEFVQIFFAPRTVSLNDLLAETIGTVAGALVGWAAAPRSATLLAALRRGGRPALRVLAGIYCLAYVALSLFPYDFVIAGDELRVRLAFVSDRLWSVPGAERSVFHALAALGFSVVAMMPVGALVARTGRASGNGIGRALAAGLLLGLLIEGLQALLLTGISDVISILARGLGAMLGAVVLLILRRADLPLLRRRLRPLAPLAVPPYLVLLAAVNDLLTGGWLGAAQAASKLGELNFMPFYYHYYTTEAVALASAASRFAMYLPVGALLWLWRRPGPIGGGAGTAALLAAVLAAVFEGARLFKSELRPDPTNVLIAAAAAGITYAVLGLGWRWLTRPAAAPGATMTPVPVGTAKPAGPRLNAERAPAESALRHPLWLVVAVLSAIAAAIGMTTYPLAPVLLALACTVYAATLWRWPQSWLLFVPALLPSFDLTPWTGRFFFNEGDILVLATAAVVYYRQPPRLDEAWIRGGAAVLVALLVLAQTIAALRGLLPLPPIGDNAFNNHFSAYNALRIAKGLAWAVLLLPALSAACRRDLSRAVARLGLGFAIGLALVVLVSLRERQIFTGLFNFEIPFRVTATFSSMHLGGGSIGAFLVMSLPFLALPFVMPAKILPAPMLRRAGAAILLVAGLYVVVVTFNRAAYFGVIAAFLVLLLALPAAVARRLRSRIVLAGALLGIAVVVAGVSTLALPGSFAGDRLGRIGHDLDTRLWEWREGLALAEPGLSSRLFGTGLGSYPRSFLLRNEGGRVPTTFAIAREEGRTFLRLGSGESLYFGQRIELRPDAAYRLSVSLRSEAADARLLVPICEKTLLYSFRCEFLAVSPRQPGNWEEHTIDLSPTGMGRPAGLVGWLTGRPVELALNNPVPGTTIEIDDVSLTARTGTSAGSELLVNGGFEAGTDRWFYAADNLAIWRIENMWLMTLFEQGWFGLVALALAVAAALLSLVRRIAGGLPAEAGAAAVLLASLSGVLVVGIAHGLLDAPRLTTLFYLLLFAGLCLGRPSALPKSRPQPSPAPPGAGA